MCFSEAWTENWIKIGQNGLDKNPEISAILDQGFWCTFQGPPQLQHISVFPLYYNHFSCSSPGTILMNTVMMIWLEGFLYGKICALTCTLAKKVQLFPGPGLYSGIFTMYLLLCPSTKSRTTIIHFYAVCLLYVLSTANFASDLVYLILYVSNNSICKNTIFFISCADASRDTIVSTSNRLTANVISHCDNPNHSKWLL